MNSLLRAWHAITFFHFISFTNSLDSFYSLVQRSANVKPALVAIRFIYYFNEIKAQHVRIYR